MNILFLLKTLDIGGVEIVTKTLANKFVEEGHNVSIFAFAPAKNSIEQSFNNIINIYIQKKLQYNKENISTLRQVLIKDSIDIIINQWGLPFLPIKIALKASKHLNVKIISIHHNSPKANGILQNIETQLSSTTNPLKRFFLHYKKIIYQQITSHSMRYVYNHSDLFMVLSPSFIEEFKSFTKISKTKKLIIQTNPVTIDSSDFQYSPMDKQKEIIYVGRIDYNQKRVYRVIDTWEKLENKYPEWKLTIVGDGLERKNLEKKVKELNLKHIRFEGFQSPKAYYERASILILTSEYEGFPLVLAECMSFGVIPVVYGSYSAVYDIIKNKTNGIIIQPQQGKFDAAEMAKQLSDLMNNEALRNKMAHEAIQTSKNNYSLKTIYQSWEKIFNKLIY